MMEFSPGSSDAGDRRRQSQAVDVIRRGDTKRRVEIALRTPATAEFRINCYVNKNGAHRRSPDLPRC